MTPEERREALDSAIWLSPLLGDYDEITPWQVLDAQLAYFDEHEPAVADAIRYGLTDEGRYGTHPGEFSINYPEGHPKR